MGACLKTKASGHSGCIVTNVTLVKTDMRVTVEKDTNNLKPTIKFLNNLLHITCSLVCSANKNQYLMVDPTFVWITPETLSGEFNIYSNVFWKID